MQLATRQLRKTQETGTEGLSRGSPTKGTDLVSGMLLQKESRVQASEILLLSVKRVVNARIAYANYKKKLVRLAGEISAHRRSSDIEDLISETVRESQIPKAEKPETMDDALRMALKRRGIKAYLLDKKVKGKSALYEIAYRGGTEHVLLNNSVMEKEDPVEAIDEALDTFGIGDNPTGSFAGGRARISTLPPPVAFEVDKGMLDTRKVTFYDESDGNMWFSYDVPGIESTFTIPAEVTGEELIAQIDRKILAMHKNFNVPYVASVLEAQVSETPAFLRGLYYDVKVIATVLHNLVRDRDMDTQMVPHEYIKAFAELRSSQELRCIDATKKISERDAKELKDALDKLRHPSHALLALIMEYHCEPDGTLTDEGRDMMERMQSTAKEGTADIEEASLRNIAEAYGLLSDVDVSGWDAKTLKERHFEMLQCLESALPTITEESL